MHTVWKKVDGMKWDKEGGQTELERLRGEEFVAVHPIEPHPVLDKDTYFIWCEPPLRKD